MPVFAGWTVSDIAVILAGVDSSFTELCINN